MQSVNYIMLANHFWFGMNTAMSSTDQRCLLLLHPDCHYVIDASSKNPDMNADIRHTICNTLSLYNVNQNQKYCSSFNSAWQSLHG